VTGIVKEIGLKIREPTRKNEFEKLKVSEGLMKEEGRKMEVKGWGGLKSKMECMGGRDYPWVTWGPPMAP
jgi:hypothetical protein